MNPKIMSSCILVALLTGVIIASFDMDLLSKAMLSCITGFINGTIHASIEVFSERTDWVEMEMDDDSDWKELRG